MTEDDLRSLIAGYVDDRRLQLGLSQVKFAKAIGADRSTINFSLSGTRRVDLKALMVLLVRLSTSVGPSMHEILAELSRRSLYIEGQPIERLGNVYRAVPAVAMASPRKRKM